MLRGNLSTRPFYNERLVGLALLAVGVIAIALTAFNAWRLLALSSEHRQLAQQIARDRQEAATARTEAANIERQVDPATLASLADSAREANELIDRRTFSWSAFFGLIEKTMPIDVRLAMVSPRVENGTFKVAMTVVARDLGDIADFMDALQGTGAFYDVIPADQQLRDDGTYTASVLASYVPPGGAARPAAAGPAPVTTPAAPSSGGRAPAPAPPRAPR